MKYIKKTDWGDFWVSQDDLKKEKLIERSLAMLAKWGIQLSDSSNTNISNEPVDKSNNDSRSH